MRWLLAAALVVGGVGCWPRPPRLPDGRVERGSLILMDGQERTVRGRIEAARGHLRDWYSVEEASQCQSITLQLRWKHARRGGGLELHVFGPRGDRWDDTKGRRLKRFVYKAAPGHYHIEVSGLDGVET